MPAKSSLLVHAKAADHFVQLYRADEPALNANIAIYLAEGFQRGHAGVVFAAPARRTAVCSELSRLGSNPDDLVAEGRLVFVDAHAALERLMVDGRPEWQVFESGTGALVSRLASTHGLVRAYGELVGVLWERRQYDAAAGLEDFWNKLLSSCKFSLFCGYPVDVFGPEFRAGHMEQLLCAHTDLISSGPNGDIAAAVDRAVYEHFGPESPAVRERIKSGTERSWAKMPAGESALLFLQDRLPRQASKLLERARHYYRVTKLLLPGAAQN